MLETVEVRNTAGTLLTLSLTDIDVGYMVEDIKGLDPVKAVLVSSSFAGMDGTQYKSSRREERNLLIKLALEPDFVIGNTVEELRHHLYNFFMTKAEVKLKFIMSSGLEVDIDGRVESCEAPPFSQEPEVDVSIICFEPDFVDRRPPGQIVTGNTVSTTDETLVDYEGTVETGIDFVLNVNRTVNEFTIYHRRPDGSVGTLNFAANLLNGDVLNISTVSGNKIITLNRGGTITSLLYGMSPQSDWIELQKGHNYIRVYAVGAPIPFVFGYFNRYGAL